MLFTLNQQDNNAVIEENGHLIYTVEKDTKDKLMSIALKNSYGDEILHFYQIKKWYQLIPALMTNEFMIYEHDEKIGELRKGKKGFDLILHGVCYHMYGGTHATKRSVIVFDRETQVAEFTLGDPCNVSFTNGVFGSLYALLMYLFQTVIKESEFPEEAFQDHYKGMYLRSLDHVTAE